MKSSTTTIRIIAVLLFLIALYIGYSYLFGGSVGTSDSVVIKESGELEGDTNTRLIDIESMEDNANNTAQDTAVDSGTESAITTLREIRQAESITLPLAGSVPTENVNFSIPIEEIRRGCFRQDCIPSVDNPEFMSRAEASDMLPEDTIGIGLVYKGEERFYPFNMLVTREIVNDTIDGDPILVTYCPLCGTGIVFDRRVDGAAVEFGVSGMLWQSNLLMYNRAASESDRNLWSQVLGEAVVGNKTGVKLSIIPSDIVRYTDWILAHPNTVVLNTGRIGDPYGGDYYRVASSFAPNFNENDSPLDPSAYVHGIEVGGVQKAYLDEAIPVGETKDTLGSEAISLRRTTTGEVSIVGSDGNEIPTVTGFWFSWVAAHPETLLWEGE